jgi:hypothetical protein
MSLSLIFIQEYHQSSSHISCNIIGAYKPQVKPHNALHQWRKFHIVTRIPEPATQVLELLCDMDVLLPTLALDFRAARIFRDTPKDLWSQIMILIMDKETPRFIGRLPVSIKFLS